MVPPHVALLHRRQSWTMITSMMPTEFLSTTNNPSNIFDELTPLLLLLSSWCKPIDSANRCASCAKGVTVGFFPKKKVCELGALGAVEVLTKKHVFFKGSKPDKVES